MKKRLHLIIEGLVQGVGFRQATVQTAKMLSLTGWVKNLPDGHVEAVAEGSEDKLQDFLKWAQQGPRGARVTEVHVRWLDALGEATDFRVMRD